jgi:precorrin-6Y C5,15-methyltransferase (decarboxylating)
MAKELFLIGVGPEGRESLHGRTLELLQGCHLIIGGKRVITQFEDLGVPTYAMSSNLRQLVDVITGAEAAVTEGRDVREAFARRPGGAERGPEDDGELGEDEDDDPETVDEDQMRRRARRRPSPRSRGRGRRGDRGEGRGDRGEGRGDRGESGDSGRGEGGDSGRGEGEARDEGAPRPSETEAAAGASRAARAEDAPKGPDTSVIDARDTSVPFAVELGDPEASDADEGLSDGEGGVAVEDAPADQAAEEGGDAAPKAEAEAKAGQEAGAETPEPQEREGDRDAAVVARIAILASGDPNFYGLSKFLLERFKKEEITIVPHVSAVQLAFAAIKEPMNDAVVTSSSGRSVDRMLRMVRQNAKIGIFTDKRRSPRAVAKLLLKHNVDARCYVCQDLGTPRERIIMGTLDEISKKNFSPLSIMILFKQAEEVPEAASGRGGQGQSAREERQPEGRNKRQRADLKEIPPPGRAPKYELVTGLGIPDEMLAARPEKIMRAEMRVIVLSKLRLETGSRMWDVGAGCGALSVEAARVAHGGEVFAVERDFAQIRNIYENIKEFGVANVTVIEGDIEAMASGLPEPDRIFIGGCGGRMSEVLQGCLKRLKAGGTLVVNAATLDSLTDVQQVLKENRLKHDLVIVNLSRTVERGGLEYFEGFNPGYLITTRKD